MPHVVHNQSSRLLLSPDGFACVGIGVARSRALTPIGIPHYLLDHIAWIQLLYIIAYQIGIVHVDVVIAVISHHHDSILPITCAGRVSDNFINHDLGITGCRNRKSSYRDIRQPQSQRGGAIACCQSLLIIQQGIEIVRHIAIHPVEGILTLVTQQIIVWIQLLATCGEHAIVPHAVTKEQKILGHFFLCGGPVIEHLHITAICRGIRCSTGELIVKFISGHDAHAQPIMVFMKSL